MKPKIYIAGKITGDPDYKAKFDAAEQEYKKKGYTVLNPSWMPQGMLPADYMRMCFAMIDTADVVAFLPGFSKSPGAQLEHAYCLYTDKSIKVPPNEPEETPEYDSLKEAYAQLKDFAEKINELGNCTTCRNVQICLFRPSAGEALRFNCPFYAKPEPNRSRMCRHTIKPVYDFSGEEAKP